jgi:hypothetical protein
VDFSDFAVFVHSAGLFFLEGKIMEIKFDSEETERIVKKHVAGIICALMPGAVIKTSSGAYGGVTVEVTMPLEKVESNVYQEERNGR